MLVAGTAVLSFRAGGYVATGYSEAPRAYAGVVAWALVAILALVLPRERVVPGRLGAAALAGLVLLTAWTAVAKSWAPLPDFAGDDVERLVLYVGAFAAALLAFSEPLARRWLEPGLALLAVVVVGYGLAGRLLPGLLEFDESLAAEGRLTQPLTYWNAMGALAAIGLVLAVRLAADPTRGRLRAPAGAVMPLLGLGLYLSFSRGALLAAVLGLAALLALSPRRTQAACDALAATGGGLAALVVTRFPAVESLTTGRDAEGEGLAMLGLLLALCASAAVVARLIARTDDGVEAADRRGRRVVALLVAIVVLIPVVGAPLALEAGDAPDRGADAGRFASAGSSRYAYWRVALETIAEHPLDGIGPGGFRVAWMEERPIDEAARDAHSLQLETGAELGLPGLAFLALFGGAVAAAGLVVLRRWASVGAGVVAGLVAWGAATAVDWMWEMPAIALVGLLLSAALAAEAAATRASAGAG